MISTDVRSVLTRRIDAYLRAFAVPPGDTILIAYSGGPDSTALLHLLRMLRPSSLEACYVDHHLRSEAERATELRTVTATAESIGVPLHVRRLERDQVAATARREGRSLEEAARQLRYFSLREAQRKAGARWLAVGHTRNDQVETILMRLFQGTGLAGLKGIPEFRPGILRPLIGTSRAELLSYLAAEKLAFIEDSTNEGLDYLRNRIRRIVLPAVESVFPQFLDGVADSGRALECADEALQFAAEELLEWERTPEGFELPAAKLAEVPYAIRLRSLLLRINELGVGGRLPEGFFGSLARYAPGRDRLLLRGHGVRLEERNGLVRLTAGDVVLLPKKSYLMAVRAPDMYHITRTLSLEFMSSGRADAPPNGVSIPVDLVRHPVVVRSHRPGDYLQMESGKKQLKKLFAEWNVEGRHRDAIPIIEDRNGILAVVGSPFGYANRVRWGAEIRKGNAARSEAMIFAFECSEEGT